MTALAGAWQAGAPSRRLTSDFETRVAARTETIELALVRDRSGFDALEGEWNDLFARAADGHQVFQSFAWCWHWANHFLGDHSRTRLAIVTARENGRLVMVWPLVSEPQHGLTIVKWMGEPVSQYGDVLVEKSADRRRLIALGWRHVVGSLNADLVQLRKVRADSAVAPHLAEIGAQQTAHAEAPYLDLASAPSFEAYQDRYSAKARKNRRRQRRRLEERGPVDFQLLAPGKDAGAVAALAISMKRAWLKERGILGAAIEDNRLRSFFADVAASPEKPTGCQVSILRSAGEAAAIQIGFVCKHRLAMHVIVYNLKLEKQAPGALAIEDCIGQAYRDKVDTFDLLAPNDGYKMEWADGVVAVADHTVPLSLAGRIYARVYLGFVRGRLKHGLLRLPMSVRKPLVRVLALHKAGGTGVAP